MTPDDLPEQDSFDPSEEFDGALMLANPALDRATTELWKAMDSARKALAALALLNKDPL